jgi:hypothetical protein
MTKLVMLNSEFHGSRTAYSSNAMFVAILTNIESKYNYEVIAESIFPDGFGVIEPPGPSFGFGVIVLSENESNGKVNITDLKHRNDEEGVKITAEALKESLEEYFDGFFTVNDSSQTITQVSFDEFYKLFEEEDQYKILHLCEFEPDEDEDEDEDED